MSDPDRVPTTNGRIDVLINAAGFVVQGALEEKPLTSLRDQFETNVVGLAAVIQAALPGMYKRESGHILTFNRSSDNAQVCAPSLCIDTVAGTPTLPSASTKILVQRWNVRRGSPTKSQLDPYIAGLAVIGNFDLYARSACLPP